MCAVNMRRTFLFMNDIGFERILSSALNHAEGYGNPIADPLGIEGSLLESWFRPGDVQQREFGQQVALQQMQNKWNSAPEQMKRLQKAGINPLLAGGNIAGSGNSPSSGAVPSTPQPISPSDIASVANAVTGGAKNLAEAVFTRKTTDPTIENLNSSTKKNLADAGLTEQEIYAWEVDNKYRDDNAQVDLRTKLLNEKNVAKQWEVMHAQYELMTTQLDTELATQKELMERARLNISQAGLADAEKGYYEKLKEKTDFEAQFAKIRVQWWYDQGYDILNSSADAILVQRLENSKSNEAIIKEWSDYYGKRFEAEQEAAAKYAYTNSYNSAAGANKANMEYDWNTPPKTMFEFITKAAVNMKSDLKSFFNGHIPQDDSKLDKSSKDMLRQSYIDFQNQVNYQRQMLMFQDADNRDDKGNIIDHDKYLEIHKAKLQLDKLPKSYNEWKKYVSSK